MNLKTLFNRKPRRHTTPLVPAFPQYERRALAFPGAGSPFPATAYAEMEQDAMVQTALTIKKLAVLAAETRIVPARDTPRARRIAAFVEQAFERMEGSPRTLLQSAMDAFAKGWSIQELVYQEADGMVWLASARPKDPQWFGLDLDRFGNLKALVVQVPGEPETRAPLGRFVVYRHRFGYGKPKGQSDLDAGWRHFQAKKALIHAWRSHLERFASPTVMGRYERGLPPEEQAGILEPLRGLHDNTAIVFPNEIEVSALHGRESDNNAFQEAIEFHNREIARSILGQTLTTDEGRRVGSLALGRVHLQVLMLQVDALRRELADSVMTEQVIRPLVELNFGPGDLPRFEFAHQPLEAFVTGRV